MTNVPYRINGTTRFETPYGNRDDAWSGFAIESRDHLYEVRDYAFCGRRYFVNSRPVDALPVTPLTRHLLATMQYTDPASPHYKMDLKNGGLPPEC